MRTVLSSLRSADTAFRNLRASSANAVDSGAMSRVHGTLNNMRQSVSAVDAGFDGVAAGVKRAADEQGRLNRHMQSGEGSARRLLSAVKGMVGAYVGLNAVKGLVGLSDNVAQTQARFNMLTGNPQDTQEMQDAVFAAAQRARAPYLPFSDAVGKMGVLAGNAFNDTGELVQFTELLNKQFAIAGTSAEGTKAAMLQITQAMGSGTLRGEELNSVLEQAPNIIKTIADYLGISVGKVREMAADGDLTSRVFKESVLGSAKEINDLFNQAPVTWSQAWSSISNTAVKALEPAMIQLSAVLSSDSGQAMIQGLSTSLLFLVQVLSGVITGFQSCSDFIVANWNTIGPLLIGGAIAIGGAFLIAGIQAGIAWIAATWPLLLIIALLGMLMLVLHESGVSFEQMGQVAGATVGGIYALLYNLVATAWNLLASIAEFFANVWKDPVGATVRLFAGMADAVLGLLQTIANGIDAVFGSNLSGAVQGWRSGLSNMVTSTFGEGKVKIARMDQIDMKSTVIKGYDTGGKMVDGISGLADKLKQTPKDYAGVPMAGMGSGIGADVSDIAGKTGKIADSMDIAEEDLKYMRDLAEQEIINRFTTAEIRVDMGGVVNKVSSNVDLDGIVDYMVGGVYEAMEIAAEGVH